MADPNWEAIDMASPAAIMQAQGVIHNRDHPRTFRDQAGVQNHLPRAIHEVERSQIAPTPSRPRDAVDIFGGVTIGGEEGLTRPIEAHSWKGEFPKGHVLYLNNVRQGRIRGHRGSRNCDVYLDREDEIGTKVWVSVQTLEENDYQVVPPEVDELIQRREQQLAAKLAETATEAPGSPESSGRRHRRIKVRHGERQGEQAQ